MKKIYTKPVLHMEDFTLSQSIAHNCGDGLDWNQANLKYKSTCGWNTGLDANYDGSIDEQDVIFVSSDACNTKVGENDFVGVCYNNPDGGLNVFNS